MRSGGPQKGNEMRATLYQHPSAKAILRDPRDPEVADKYAMPQLGHDEPIRATVPADEEQFCVCGIATRHLGSASPADLTPIVTKDSEHRKANPPTQAAFPMAPNQFLQD